VIVICPPLLSTWISCRPAGYRLPRCAGGRRIHQGAKSRA